MLVAHLRNARRPSDYQSDALTSVLVSINWSGRQDLHLRPGELQARPPAADSRPECWTRRLDLRQPLPGCSRSPDYLGHSVKLGRLVRLALTNTTFTESGLGYFAFSLHRLVPSVRFELTLYEF
jgi:hypothetical protein